MTQYAKIAFWAVLFGLVSLPHYSSAASIKAGYAAIGEACTASGIYSTAMGYQTNASNESSTTMGWQTNATGKYSTAMGGQTRASNDYSTSMGFHSTASGKFSTAMGSSTTASGASSTAMGDDTAATGNYSTAMGLWTTASKDGSTIIGTGWASDIKLTNDIQSSFMVGYMADSSDTTPEFFVTESGVGINNTNPQTAFHIKKEVAGTPTIANHVAAIENTYATDNPNVLMLKVNIANPGSACKFVTFRDSTGNVGYIEGDGGGVTLTSGSADFAEYLPKADPNETLIPGDIVGLFPEGVSKKTQNARRLMVLTSTPAVLGNRPMENEKSAYAPVAFLGQVPVRVKGVFSAGDFIIPSGDGDGIGIAVSPNTIQPSQYASVIGRALTSNTAKGINKATVIVGLPQNELWNGVIKQKEEQIAQLEERLAALEAKAEKTVDFGMLPGAGILIGSLGFLWMGKKRRRS